MRRIRICSSEFRSRPEPVTTWPGDRLVGGSDPFGGPLSAFKPPPPSPWARPSLSETSLGPPRLTVWSPLLPSYCHISLLSPASFRPLRPLFPMVQTRVDAPPARACPQRSGLAVCARSQADAVPTRAGLRRRPPPPGLVEARGGVGLLLAPSGGVAQGGGGGGVVVRVRKTALQGYVRIPGIEQGTSEKVYLNTNDTNLNYFYSENSYLRFQTGASRLRRKHLNRRLPLLRCGAEAGEDARARLRVPERSVLPIQERAGGGNRRPRD